MFDAQHLLGTLVSTGMGGLLGGGQPSGGNPYPSDNDPQVSGSSFTQLASGGVGQAASLALLGTLAYKAYQSYQGRVQQAPQGGQSSGGQPTAGSIVAGLMPSAPPPASPPQGAAPQLGESDAQILIRAMVAAANADGHVDPDEESRIYQLLEKTGASEEDQRFIAAEMRAPASIDTLVREARDPEMASHIYAVSLLAIDTHNATNQSYLRYLANRIGLDEATIATLHRQVGAPPLPQ
ncbi:MAG: tellurite resistance TerB family protein [Alphaproteobacteria bacterium]|nr:tellurite resistance TerB family protein [Alphaproteobacteria bacterium]